MAHRLFPLVAAVLLLARLRRSLVCLGIRSRTTVTGPWISALAILGRPDFKLSKTSSLPSQSRYVPYMNGNDLVIVECAAATV